MKILLSALIISTVFLGLSLPWLIRTYARRISDKIICGPRPGSEKLLRRCISLLSWCNEWVSNNVEPDIQRINRLRSLLDEMQKPHG